MNALLATENHFRGAMISSIDTKSGDSQRDPRAMNHMDPETKLIHADLEVWGKETRDRAENGLPAVTILGRLIDQGPMGAGQTGRPTSDLSPRSALIDACVARLWGIGKRCIKRYYQSWEPMEVMARKEGISVSQMKDVLRRSRWLINSWAMETA